GRILAHARYVGLDRAREELHILWQIADVLTELPLVPVPEIHEIEPYAARRGQDRAHQHLAKRRLAGAGIPDHAKRIPGGKRESDAVEDNPLGALWAEQEPRSEEGR